MRELRWGGICGAGGLMGRVRLVVCFFLLWWGGGLLFLGVLVCGLSIRSCLCPYPRFFVGFFWLMPLLFSLVPV